MRTIARRAAVGVALVGALLFTTACTNPASPDAATVNGTSIGRDELFDQARAYASVSGDPFQFGTETEGSYSSDAMAGLLSSNVSRILVEDAAEQFGIEPDQALMDEIRNSPQLGEAANLPAEEFDAYIRNAALTDQVIRYVDENEWWTDDDVAAYDEIARAQGETQVCARHILVETEDEANEIIDELADDGDFATIAGERSIDTGSAASGGDLGCADPAQYVDEFGAAVESAEIGEVVGPVETEFGFHVIERYAFEPVGLEEAGSQGWIELVVRSADVMVDPRFGRWDSDAFQVVPPEGAQLPASSGLDLTQ